MRLITNWKISSLCTRNDQPASLPTGIFWYHLYMNEIELMPYDETYLSYFVNWLNDEELMRSMDMGPFSDSQIKEWPTQEGQVTLIIKDKATDEVMGFSNFHHFKDDGNAAQVGILIDPSYQGRGYGMTALSQTRRYGFEKLRLKRIIGYAKFGNVASEKTMEKCGFVVDYRDDQKERTYYRLEPGSL